MERGTVTTKRYNSESPGDGEGRGLGDEVGGRGVG